MTIHIKNLLSATAVIIIGFINALDMEAKDKKLPAPDFKGGMPVNEVIANRHSTREFDHKREIDDAALGQILWMTLGVNRPEAKDMKFEAVANRSNPTARNWQEIRAFVFTKGEVSEYMPDTHSLRHIVDGDHRKLLAGTQEFSQDFVMDAPCAVLFVADLDRLPDSSMVTAMGMVDAGIACENLNIACASLGIATIPRATMDSAGIAKLLNLSARQLPVINNPMGYQR